MSSVVGLRVQPAKLDINIATAEDFGAIDGLTRRAPEIVRYRGGRGGFAELCRRDEVPGLVSKVSDAARAQSEINP